MKSSYRTILAFAVLTAVSLGLFLYNQYSSELPDPDAFYHLQMAQLSAQFGLVRDFPWLPYTTLAEHFVDQHLVFHWLMIPFVSFGDPFMGLRVFTALLGTASIVSVAVVLRALRLRWWWLASIVLLLTIPVTFRLNLVKAAPLSIMALTGIVWALVKRRPVWLFLISWAFVWLHGGFALAIPVVGMWMLAELANQPRAIWKRVRTWLWWRPIVVTCAGIGLGLVANPYFPDNLYFYWEQLVQIGIMNYGSVIGVGNEWYPYAVHDLLIGGALLTLVWLAALMGTLWRREQWNAADWFGLGISIFGLAITLKSRRYVEYYGPFIAIAAAIWLDHVAFASRQAWDRLLYWINYRTHEFAVASLVVALICLSVVPVILNDIRSNAQDVRSGLPVTKYQSAMTWLQQRAQPGDVIVHSDWDDFPILFYYGPQFRYMNGLDPTFMYRADPERYQTWVDITTGKYTGDLETALRDVNAAYIFVETDHQSMFNLVNSLVSVSLVYEDEEAWIFEFKQ